MLQRTTNDIICFALPLNVKAFIKGFKWVLPGPQECYTAGIQRLFKAVDKTIMFSSIYRLTPLLVLKEVPNNSKTINAPTYRAEGTKLEDGRQIITQKWDMYGRNM